MTERDRPDNLGQPPPWPPGQGTGLAEQTAAPMTEDERAAQAASILAALRADPNAIVLPGTKEHVMLTSPNRLGPFVEPPEWGFWKRWMWRLFAPRHWKG